jgi:hypothetical protein
MANYKVNMNTNTLIVTITATVIKLNSILYFNLAKSTAIEASCKISTRGEKHT